MLTMRLRWMAQAFLDANLVRSDLDHDHQKTVSDRA
jgi:hypothetical protein